MLKYLDFMADDVNSERAEKRWIEDVFENVLDFYELRCLVSDRLYIYDIADWVKRMGCTLYLVGGAVRDKIISTELHDYDFVIVGDYIIREAIKMALKCFGRHSRFYDVVRIEFNEEDEDGWTSYVDAEFSFAEDLYEDLKRRDLTINAVAWDPLTEEYIDPFGGMEDIRKHVLRATSAEAFNSGNEPFRLAHCSIKMFNKTSMVWNIDSSTIDVMKNSPINKASGYKLFKTLESLNDEERSTFDDVLAQADIYIERIDERCDENTGWVEYCPVFG